MLLIMRMIIHSKTDEDVVSHRSAIHLWSRTAGLARWRPGTFAGGSGGDLTQLSRLALQLPPEGVQVPQRDRIDAQRHFVMKVQPE